MTVENLDAAERLRLRDRLLIENYRCALPLLASTVAELTRIGAYGAEELVQLQGLVARDPAFAIRLLVLCSANAVGDGDRFKTLAAALEDLSPSLLIASVRQAVVVPAFVGTSRIVQELTLHSQLVALWSEAIARMVNSVELPAKEAYLAGLVHDLGRFILLYSRAEEIAAVADSGWDSGPALIAEERSQFGTDHVELGTLAARTWNLPAEISHSIAGHHGESPIGTISSGHKLLMEIVATADRLSFIMTEHPTFTQWSVEKQSAYLESSGILPVTSLLFPYCRRVAGLVSTVAIAGEEAAEAALGVKLRPGTTNEDDLLNQDEIEHQKLIRRKSDLAL